MVFSKVVWMHPHKQREEFRRRSDDLTQRLLSALVALSMVLSVCAPAFADVTDPDMAKAAQWCTEQGTMGAKGDRFNPGRSTEVRAIGSGPNKAFPQPDAGSVMPCSIRIFSVKMGAVAK